MLIDIARLRKYYADDMVFVTAHASERFRQRGIKTKDIRYAVQTGEIIEQYPDDYPYPNCLILGKTIDNCLIHIVMSDEGSASRIITAYFPNVEKWESDFKTRKVR